MLVASMAALAACGGSGDDKEEPPIQITGRIGAAGGALTLESPDGSSFELRVPAGALSDDQEITIRRIPVAEWPPEAQDNPPIGGAIFELLPEGTTFQQPATTLTRYPAAPPGLGGPGAQTLPSHVSRSSAGTMSRHSTTIHNRRDGSAAVLAQTSHFSHHWASTQTPAGEYGIAIDWPEEGVVEMEFMPMSFSIWNSSSDSNPLPVAMELGVFVGMDDPEQAVGTAWFENGMSILESGGGEFERAFFELLNQLESSAEVSSDGLYVQRFIFEEEFGLTYPVDEPLPLDPMTWGPMFMCMSEGAGTGFVFIQTYVPDGAGGEVTLSYLEEVAITCGPTP